MVTRKRDAERGAVGSEMDPAVARYLEQLEHPLKREVEELRGVILGVGLGLREGIKWNAPSYSVAGEDRVTFNLSAKDKVRLIFHRGARVKDGKGKGRLLEDDSGLLEWASDDRAIATFRTMDEVMAGKAALKRLVRRWIEATCEE
jgi:uncharacterized protein YdeI (YjbR/CyaY-like superfamily)